MRKALCVGIDSYQFASDLHGCVNDANAVKSALERNGDGTLNFQTQIMCATSEKSYITRANLKDAIHKLFKDDSEIAVFYYAGHGSYDSLGGYLCTSEVKRADDGLSLNDVMGIVSESKAKNKVVILDSCHSGFAASSTEMQNYSVLKSGTTILAACDEKQYSSEENGHGVFTTLLIEALYGGAMNLLGEVSPGSIYSYIDRSLGGWDQRPVFKANIKTFVSLRRNSPPIEITELQRITEIFPTPYEEFALDPTYEPDKHEADIKEINREHEAIFKILQKYVKLNLVIPVGAEHMYYAAINHKSCKLTAQGQHYWNLVRKNII
ncbi:MAG: caspase family protein [Oscillospiraceae bacterium]|nr:caspase family protein [Oscillospiraceae bacterium]